MEEALLSLQQNRLQQENEFYNADDAKKPPPICGAEFDENMACLAFARALRNLSLVFPSPSSSSSAAAAVAASAKIGEEKTESAAPTAAASIPNAEWLYNLCATVPSELGPLQLSLAVLSACQRDSEGEVQAVLFDALGEGERAMEIMFEIAPLAQAIKEHKRMNEGSLRAIERGEKGGNYDDGVGEETLVDVEEERRRLLREEAIEAANVAAAAKAAAGMTPDDGGITGPASSTVTHTVARKSDKEAQKFAKKAAKRAAAALAAAKEAGAILDNEDLGMTDPSTFDYDALQTEGYIFGSGGKMGLEGMTKEEIQEMQRRLAPEGTKHYYEKKGLPPGTEREYGPGYEMVTIPAPIRDKSKLHPRIEIASAMNAECQRAFAGTTSLNPMQSEVFEAAFHTQENLLICAPTGAGKTNVAMLTVVAHLRDKGIIKNEDDPYAAYAHIGDDGGGSSSQAGGGVGRKVIYIAPMKALAQEVVEKFSSKLKALNIIVRELTGDMQLTRLEAENSDIIVTTPEKWDVVTRKGGDGSLGRTCGLLIIDEVHLLADERGAVIESVVARLHRLVESSQRQVRIVGLSATLPNYKDVASFLKVHPERGLFYFGPEHRPVPLQQTFVGVTNVKDRYRREQKMNEVCYEVVSDSLRRGYQVMVFVHSRKGTGETARALTELAMKEGSLESLFITKGTERNGDAYTRYVERATKSRNRELTEHFHNGLGIHHAGMLRNDRKLTEQMFNDGAIKVLCCTATLAWGINLPAHTVVIKGTEVYNPEKGGTVDLSILDVQQIFGRAGRPQFDTSGEATLITSHDSLAPYLDKLIRAVPIESNFVKQLADHLNAEVVGGTVTNIQEAVTWLAYTYLYVRMCRNPIAYGINADQHEDDPMLRGRSKELVEDAAKQLDLHRMLRYDRGSGNLAVTDLGRVASHFYIRSESVAIFNEMLANLPDPNDADLCHIICCAQEFENVRVRAEELSEVDDLRKKSCPLPVKAPVEEFSGKCCVLLQAYIGNARVNGFTLISDTNYIASNAGRVARALFEMCLKRGLAGAAARLLRIAKSVDSRIWWFQSPLRQFPGEVPSNALKALESRKLGEELGMGSLESTISLLDMQPNEVGQLCHWYRGGEKIQNLTRMLPRLEISCNVQPVTRGILRFQVTLDPVFEWNGRWHGGAEGFWLWVEDGENNRIYHHEYVLMSRRTHPDPVELELTIPAFDPLPPQYFLRVVSVAWVGCEMLLPVSFQHLLLPDRQMPYTDLIDLTPIPTSALHEPKFEQLYSKFETFNPIQTQLFHVLYHTDTPVLLGAPTGSGKTIVAEIALLRMKKRHPKGKCVYIAPLKSLARERLKEWRKRLASPPLNWKVLELSGDTRHDTRAMNTADVLVCTPEKWDLITRGWKGTSDASGLSPVNNKKKFIDQVRLLVIDEIHLLGEERGAVLEAIVSRTRFISRFVKEEMRKKAQSNDSSGSKELDGDDDITGQHELTRIMGLSTALANPYDLADWIGIDTKGHDMDAKRGLYNFRPSVRPIPMEVHIQGFPGREYCPRMASMNKPCYAAINEHSPNQPVIIFVASRRQTRLTALDLISYAAGDENPRAFLGCSDDYVESVASTIMDQSLRHTLTFGVGLHHAGLSSHDRETVEKMFLNGDIQILVATATLAWGVNLPAHLVIVKGTEFFDGKTMRYVDYPVTDVLQMMGRAGRPQFDTRGIACVMVQEGKKNFYKKFLYEPFPVESCLGDRLCDNINAEIAIGTINDVSEAVGYLGWTFFARRAKMNPSYYGAVSGSDGDQEEFFLSVIKDAIAKLKESGCVDASQDNGELGDEFSVTSTVLGTAASNFYLQYQTPKQMRIGCREVRKIIYQQLDNLEQKEAEKSTNEAQGSPAKGRLVLSPYNPPPEVETIAVSNLLYVLSETHEFDEVPVRHNEEHLNEELSEKLPWGAKPLGVSRSIEAYGGRHFRETEYSDLMLDPHTKCFLLLQAFIVKAKLPISDYINDTKTVIDQVPRLLAAMQYIALDDASTAGVFDLISYFTRLRQMLSTRTMVNINPFNQIPRFPKDGGRKLRNRGIMTLHDLRSLPIDELAKAIGHVYGNGNKVKHISNKAMQFLNSIPLVVIENTKTKHEVCKTSGRSTGRLNFDVILDTRETDSKKSRGMGSQSGFQAESNITVVLGSFQGNCLLCHKSVSISGERMNKKHQSIEMTFDWALANANGGSDGGSMIMRILREDIRGMDSEIIIPLQIGG